MQTLILSTDAGDSGTACLGDYVCAAIELKSEIVELCERRIELAKTAYAQDSSLARLCFRDPGGPEFFGDDLLSACAEASDEFHDDFINNSSAVMPAGVTLDRRQAGAVDYLLMVVLQFQYEDNVRLEIGWTATPDDTNRRIATASVPLDYLKQILQDGEAGSLCECELPGYFYSGVPGIIARVENGRLAAGANVERCDLCQRFPTDEAALAKLRELGIT